MNERPPWEIFDEIRRLEGKEPLGPTDSYVVGQPNPPEAAAHPNVEGSDALEAGKRPATERQDLRGLAEGLPSYINLDTGEAHYAGHSLIVPSGYLARIRSEVAKAIAHGLNQAAKDILKEVPGVRRDVSNRRRNPPKRVQPVRPAVPKQGDNTG